MPEQRDLGKTSIGIDANLAAMLAYVVGWVTGLVFFLLEKDNKFVRFHAMQSMMFFGAWQVINIIFWPHHYWRVPLQEMLSIIAVIVWIVGMIKAYQGETFKLPVIGDIAAKQAGL